MSEYKRHYQSGGNYFFTLVTHQRNPILTTPDNIVQLKVSIKKVKHKYPFSLDANEILNRWITAQKTRLIHPTLGQNLIEDRP